MAYCMTKQARENMKSLDVRLLMTEEKQKIMDDNPNLTLEQIDPSASQICYLAKYLGEKSLGNQTATQFVGFAFGSISSQIINIPGVHVNGNADFFKRSIPVITYYCCEENYFREVCEAYQQRMNGTNQLNL